MLSAGGRSEVVYWPHRHLTLVDEQHTSRQHAIASIEAGAVVMYSRRVLDNRRPRKAAGVKQSAVSGMGIEMTYSCRFSAVICEMTMPPKN